MREADIERALGARHDLFPRGDRREGAIPGGSAFERRTRILDEAPRAGLVEVLMGVDQSRDNKLPTEVDHLSASLGVIVGAKAAMRPFEPIARSSNSGCLAPACRTRAFFRRSDTPLKQRILNQSTIRSSRSQTGSTGALHRRYCILIAVMGIIFLP